MLKTFLKYGVLNATSVCSIIFMPTAFSFIFYVMKMKPITDG